MISCGIKTPDAYASGPVRHSHPFLPAWAVTLGGAVVGLVIVVAPSLTRRIAGTAERAPLSSAVSTTPTTPTPTPTSKAPAVGTDQGSFTWSGHKYQLTLDAVPQDNGDVRLQGTLHTADGAPDPSGPDLLVKEITIEDTNAKSLVSYDCVSAPTAASPSTRSLGAVKCDYEPAALPDGDYTGIVRAAEVFSSNHLGAVLDITAGFTLSR